jgi:hypothetical protein
MIQLETFAYWCLGLSWVALVVMHGMNASTNGLSRLVFIFLLMLGLRVAIDCLGEWLVEWLGKRRTDR